MGPKASRDIFAVMQVLIIFLFFLSLSCSEDTVAEDLGTHQLRRLVDLLTVHECEEFFLALTSPEENIFKQLKRLSAEKNQLRLHPRTKRDIDKEAHCYPALTDWLQIHGKQTYYDRLSRALQQIGRTDIAIEVGKNLNQDKTLGLQRYVEEYHKQVNKIASHFILSQTEEDHHEQTLDHSSKQVRSLSWKDLDLVVDRQLVPPYQRQLLDEAWPLLYGVIFGLFAALAIGVPVMLLTMQVCLGDQQELHLACQSQTQNHGQLYENVAPLDGAGLLSLRQACHFPFSACDCGVPVWRGGKTNYPAWLPLP
ncbi:transmembrane and death domain protein 1 [Salminus brasiliensis]|uniref:transmembrane and death domain protein 1 n=1 Tax=Salminus brasiliensis TaxID=930266 RepID=UPI003B838E9D